MTATMSVKRGRPFGSGIDDGERLRQLANYLLSHGGSVQGALRALGITDPSHVRRLRDKHNRAQRLE